VAASICSVLSSFGRQPSPDTEPLLNPPSISIAIINGLLLALLIFAFAPGSGGHLNPMITFATMLTGHTQIYRGIVYIAAQVGGACIGSQLVEWAVPDATAQWSTNTYGQVLRLLLLPADMLLC